MTIDRVTLLSVADRQARDLHWANMALDRMMLCRWPSKAEAAQRIADVISFVSAESESRGEHINSLLDAVKDRGQ